MRREDPHPGAQPSLFDTVEGKRHTAFITDTTSGDIAQLELRHRQRGRAEGVVRDVKACGLAKLPFDCIVNNDAWMRMCFTANDLLVWGRRISLDGPMQRATPRPSATASCTPPDAPPTTTDDSTSTKPGRGRPPSPPPSTASTTDSTQPYEQSWLAADPVGVDLDDHLPAAATFRSDSR